MCVCKVTFWRGGVRSQFNDRGKTLDWREVVAWLLARGGVNSTCVNKVIYAPKNLALMDDILPKNRHPVTNLLTHEGV